MRLTGSDAEFESKEQHDRFMAEALANCAREPIHLIGSIQAEGVLLVFDAASWRLRAASANLENVFAVRPAVAIGRSADELLGSVQATQLRELVTNPRDGASIWSIAPILADVDGRLDAQVYRIGGDVVLEIERRPQPKQDVFHQLFIPIRDALWRLDAEADLDRYSAAVVDQVRLLTGFDRVMMYRFDSNWDGEVIAESRSEDVGSYLGSRFPASDIPAQARELYTRNLVRLIADVDSSPVSIVAERDAGTPVDLTYSWLRSLSPVHIEYLRNMGVKASLSISLVQNGQLWGLIACHHLSPKYVSLRERELDEFIGRVVSLKLIQMDGLERAEINARIRHLLYSLTEGIRAATDLDMTVQRFSREFLGVVRADGAVVSVGGTRHRLGQVPSAELVETLVKRLRIMTPAPVFHTVHLAEVCPELAGSSEIASGMMVAPLDHEMRDFVMWFRAGVVRTLRWAGRPDKFIVRDANGPRLSPRDSFDAWLETYRDKSANWTHVEVDAANSLSLALIEVLAERALRSKEESYRLLAENSTDMIAAVGRDGKVGFVSPACVELLGRPAEWIVGHSAADFVFPDDRQVFQRTLDELGTRGGTSTVLLRANHAEGRIVWIEATVKLAEAAGDRYEFVMNARDVTQRHTYQLAIEEMHRRNSRILDAAGDALLSLDQQGAVTFANEVAIRLLQRPVDSLLGTHCCDVLQPRDDSGLPFDRAACPFLATVADGEIRHGTVLLGAEGESGTRVARYVCTPLLEEQSLTGAVIVFNEMLGQPVDGGPATEVILDQAAEAVMVTDAEGRITSVNRAFSEITGYSTEEAIGRTPRILKSGVHTPHFYEEFWRTLCTDRRWVGEVWNRRKNGEIYPQWGSVTAVLDDSGKPVSYVAVFSDISKAKKAEERLYYLANHDTLTGLPNRMRLSEQLDAGIERAKRSGAMLAVAFVDLDRFKIINDTLGHAVGDQFLKTLADRLQHSARKQDTLARWGGDEFVLVLEDASSREAIGDAITRLMQRLGEPVFIDGQEIVPTASIGISVYPDDGRLPGDLIKAADAAMYRAKEQGRNRFAFYTQAIQEEVSEKFGLAGEIRRGLTGGEFRLHYQPQIDAQTGKLVGVEALARWQHPSRGLLGPANFIALAEEIGLISELGEWVLKEACRQMRAWQDEGIAVPRVAVNVSPLQLHDPFVEVVGYALRESGIPPAALEIEITEGAMEAGEAVTRVMRQLRALGVLLSVDDFGTGYSSLSHIKLFPITCFKIDKSFIDGVPQNSADVAIVRTILALGLSLKVEVVAEGVETAEQARFLQEAGVTSIQGYYYGVPMTPQELEAFVASTLAGEAASVTPA